MANETIIPGAEPEDTPKQEVIEVPDQIMYGICIFETTDPLAEPIIHVHAPDEFKDITVAHLYRLLAGAVKSLEAELIYSKFQHKAQQGSKIITRSGGSL